MRVAILLAVCIALAGCNSNDTFQNGELSYDVTGSPIAEGGQATIDVTFEVRKPFTYNHPGCAPDTFQATVQHGDGIPLWEYGAEQMFGPCVVREVTLQPGTYQATFHWNGHLGPGNGSGGPHSGSRLAPGSYEVLIELRGDVERQVTAIVQVA